MMLSSGKYQRRFFLYFIYIFVLIVKIHSGQNNPSYLDLFNGFCKLWKNKSLNFVLPELSSNTSDLFYHEILAPFKLQHCKQRWFYSGLINDLPNPVSVGFSINILLAKSATDVRHQIHKKSEIFNKQVWLLPETFLNTDAILQLKLTSDIYCYKYMSNQNYFLITEKYSILSRFSKSVIFGQYSKDSGLKVSYINKWERRQNFTGVTLVSSILEWKPLSQPIFDTTGNLSDVVGSFPLVLELIKDKLDFETKWLLPADGKWGSKESNGNWNGMVGLMEMKKIDLICAPVTMTMERTFVMDFTLPVYHDTYTLISQKNEGIAPNIWGYLITFTAEAWISIFTLLLCITILYFTINTFFKYDIFQQAVDQSSSLTSCVTLVYLNFIQIEYPVYQRSVSTKLLHFTSCMFACIIFAFYSADLTSRLTVNPPSFKIKSFTEAYEQGYAVAVYSGSATEVMMSAAGKGTGMNKIWEDQIKSNPELRISSNEELKSHILESKKNLAFLPSLFLMTDSRFEALEIEDSTKSSNAFGLQKDSELLEAFNYHLLKIQESGILDYTLWPFLNPRSKLEAHLNDHLSQTSDDLGLGFSTISLPFIFLFMGIVLSIIISCHERSCFKDKTISGN